VWSLAPLFVVLAIVAGVWYWLATRSSDMERGYGGLSGSSQIRSA